MRIVKDGEGDFWEETDDGFKCMNSDYWNLDDKSLKWIENRYPPITIYAPVKDYE